MQATVTLTGRIFHFRGNHVAEWAGTTEEGIPIQIFSLCVKANQRLPGLDGNPIFDIAPDDAITLCPESGDYLDD